MGGWEGGGRWEGGNGGRGEWVGGAFQEITKDNLQEFAFEDLRIKPAFEALVLPFSVVRVH